VRRAQAQPRPCDGSPNNLCHAARRERSTQPQSPQKPVERRCALDVDQTTRPTKDEPPDVGEPPSNEGGRWRTAYTGAWQSALRWLRARPRWQLAFLAFVVMMLLLWLAYEGIHGAQPQIAGSGTIENIQVDVAPKVSGRIQALLVQDGDPVKAGQPIAQIEKADAQLALAQAKATLDAAKARLQLAQASYALQRDVNQSQVGEAQAVVAASAARVPQSEKLAGIQASTVSAQVDAATAHLRSASAALETARATLAGASADVVTAQAAEQLAQANFKRSHELYAQGAISAQQNDERATELRTTRAELAAAVAHRSAAAKQVAAAEAALREAHADLDLAIASQQTVAVKQLDIAASSAQLAQSKAALAGAQAQSHALDQRRADVAQANADVEQAQVAVAIAQRQLDETTLYAPFDGVVLSHSAEVGDLVVPQTTVMTVADVAHPYLDLYVSETDLARVKVGQPVDVRIDGAPNRIFHGQVTSIRTTAEFTPSNVQTKEQRAELVFRVRIDLPNPDGTLKAGIPADGVIHTAP